MANHLYVCETGGPMALGVDGSPPLWATCPVCASALECARCHGAELSGAAPPFPVGVTLRYRCAKGHERWLSLPVGAGRPESAQCPDCGDGMLLPEASRPASS